MNANEYPVCHYQAKDLDELLEHVEGSCQKGLDELAEEVGINPRKSEPLTIKIPDRIPGADKDTMDLSGFDFETVNELMNSPRDYCYEWNGKEHVRVRKFEP